MRILWKIVGMFFGAVELLDCIGKMHRRALNGKPGFADGFDLLADLELRLPPGKL